MVLCYYKSVRKKKEHIMYHSKYISLHVNVFTDSDIYLLYLESINDM